MCPTICTVIRRCCADQLAVWVVVESLDQRSATVRESDDATESVHQVVLVATALALADQVAIRVTGVTDRAAARRFGLHSEQSLLERCCTCSRALCLSGIGIGHRNGTAACWRDRRRLVLGVVAE